MVAVVYQFSSGLNAIGAGVADARGSNPLPRAHRALESSSKESKTLNEWNKSRDIVRAQGLSVPGVGAHSDINGIKQRLLCIAARWTMVAFNEGQPMVEVRSVRIGGSRKALVSTPYREAS